MGNSGCVGTNDLCATREFPSFLAPNTKHVTFSFDFQLQESLQLAHGCAGSSSPSQGFLVEPPQEPEGLQEDQKRRLTPKWYTVKEYAKITEQECCYVSGRCLITCPDGKKRADGMCAFAVCTRGRWASETLRTWNHEHKVERIASGVVFALFCYMQASGLFLCPRIMLLLECGDVVLLVEDRLGPILPPQSFYADFAIVDDAVNVQLDVILRGCHGSGVPGPSEVNTSMKTVRTCLQDYVAFNSHLKSAYVAVGYSNLATHLEDASVYLQNLVISEEPQFGNSAVEETERRRNDAVEEEVPSGVLLFEGADVPTALAAFKMQEAQAVHPQLCRAASRPSPKLATSVDGGMSSASNVFKGPASWFHISYNGDSKSSDKKGLEGMKGFSGEFWLSRASVEKKNVYFQCSSTLSQALTMCIGMRFSCPTEYLTLIQEGEKGARVLRHMHIPTNSVIMGIEHDPRSKALLRMFVECRNEVLDDMPVCECGGRALDETLVHQEIYDSGDTLTYRITCLHKDGSRQSASLEINLDQIEDAGTDTARSQFSGGLDEPSSRFPTSKAASCHNLSPANRIFLYTSVAYSQQAAAMDELAESDGGSSMYGTATAYATPMLPHVSPEDFHSVGLPCSDACSDADLESVGGWGTPCAGNGEGTPRLRPTPAETKSLEVAWLRPLIESCSLSVKQKQMPFKRSHKGS